MFKMSWLYGLFHKAWFSHVIYEVNYNFDKYVYQQLLHCTAGKVNRIVYN